MVANTLIPRSTKYARFLAVIEHPFLRWGEHSFRDQERYTLRARRALVHMDLNDPWFKENGA